MMSGLTVHKLRVVDPAADKPKKRKDPVLAALDKNLPLPPFRILINGPSGSGKSSTFKWLLLNKYPGVFEEIFIFCPTFSTDRTFNDMVTYQTIEEVDPNSIKKDKHGKPLSPNAPGYQKPTMIKRKVISPNSNLQPEDVIEESDPKIIIQILDQRWEMCKKAVEEAEESGALLPRSLFVFDDLSIELASSTVLSNYFTKGRKYGISIVLMSNKYKTYPPVIRNNCTQFLFFKPTTKAERDAISTDVAGAIDPKVVPKLMDQVYQKNGDFLYVDMTTSEDRRFRRNFDEPLSLPRSVLG